MAISWTMDDGGGRLTLSPPDHSHHHDHDHDHHHEYHLTSWRITKDSAIGNKGHEEIDAM
jgi:hypothetical protein